jgi:acetyl esterase/lipase
VEHRDISDPEPTHRKARRYRIRGGGGVLTTRLRVVITAVIAATVMVCAWGVLATGAASADRASAETIRAVRYGPEPHQLLDLYLPARSGTEPRIPTIVYLHSGGWIAGSRSNVAIPALAQLPRGYAIASVDYQLATPGGNGSFPGAVYDVKRAIRFLKAGAERWGLDPSRIILMGTSAGGHLAALSAASASVGRLEPHVTGPLAAVDSRVAAVVDIVGITDLATFSVAPHPWAAPLTAEFLGCPMRNGRAECPSTRLRAASVAPYVTSATPPIFMAYGAKDNLVVPATQGAPLVHAWVQAHHGDPGSAVYEVVPGGGHNIGNGQVDMRDLDHFLDQAAGRS